MRTKLFMAAMAFLGLASSAVAAPNTYELRLEGHVPVICRVDLQASGASADHATDLGRMTEFCNSAAGYDVWLSHAQGLSGAAVYVDGQKIPLSASGQTLISHSSTAASRSHALRLDPGADAGRVGDLSLRISAL
ncbi:hypothetical protein [Caulobacter sp. UNC279MFTsu5.1]|uniref:hypothetical protein n=1 Tax=Caulobacter sp. UNC279MFTsu5.1 TaxID=1502775 RepID=UPI0008E13CBA|nr:hypothetical protein [Caulobacter sp. UNC279MFTsu5.1]SFJ65995.1 hypothetical protein SAMN02799626_02290 [Caulobacter sp. UNC279MFTsu5.1]